LIERGFSNFDDLPGPGQQTTINAGSQVLSKRRKIISVENRAEPIEEGWLNGDTKRVPAGPYAKTGCRSAFRHSR
jgi:hypothetical protein